MRGRGRAPLPWATPAAPSEPSSPAHVALSATEREALAGEPFETLSEDQVAQIGAWLAESLPRMPRRRPRRRRPGRCGDRVALRATLARARRTEWELVQEERVRRPRRLVVLCDVSESVRTQSAVRMHLMRALVRSSARAEAFAFATRLTRLTPVLAHSDVDAALERAGETVADRFGGTRIAASVHELLTSRHGASVRGAVVLVLSDGWDSGSPERIAAVMARLRRRAHRVVWANPRAAAPGFEPRAAGMAAALPHCDEFLPAHSFAALRDVIAAVADTASPGPRGRREVSR